MDVSVASSTARHMAQSTSTRADPGRHPGIPVTAGILAGCC